MYKVYFQRWVFGRMQDVQTSLEVLDGYNKTKFSRKINKDERALQEAAKYAHDHQLLYFVTVFKEELPYCYLEINKDFFSVSFLDDYLRKYMEYTFYGKTYNLAYFPKLFLGQIWFQEFKEKSSEVLKITDYRFRPDGSLHITERDPIKNEQVDSEAKSKVDVASNWEVYPEFGRYESLIRKER